MTTVIELPQGNPAPWLEGIEGCAAHKLIESNDTVTRVVAGPGSGKTTCLKRRIQRLVQKEEVDPQKIFVGTFTRAIAKELRDALGTEVQVSTLHSLAFELLRKHPAACQGMHLRFLLKHEEDTLLYDIENAAAQIGDLHKRREALRLLQASRAQRTVYGNAAFAGAIRTWLQRHRGMLIGEVVYLCVTGLESADIAPSMFDHVVIDEYQDLTVAEQELVSLIWSGTGTLTVLGDDDQSIYGFRFNHPKGITDFRVHWPECTDLTFLDNRRCGEEILETANLMMAEAGATKPPMNSKSGRDGKLTAVQWNTLDEEIIGLTKYINACSDQSFLVLVPRRFIGYRLAEAVGGDANTMFAEEVLEHPIAQESFIALGLVADSEDFVSARAWLGLHGAKKEPGQRRNADAYATLPTDTGGQEMIRRLASEELKVLGQGQANLRMRAKKAVEIIDRDMNEEETIEFLFNDALAEEEPDDEKRRWLTEDLRQLRNAAKEILERQDSPNLARVVEILRYRIATRSPLSSTDAEEPRVRIMTLHSAKGLEADNVVITGVGDQFVPGDEPDAERLAEQKRLLYVAITRAKDSLIISWPRRVPLGDLMKNMGHLDDVITEKGVKWAITSRSSLLPQGLAGVISGDQFLANAIPPISTGD
jgi:DNA helicase-2/ATP-dependent DNA helicase PcrA